jgi:uncharacterized membrane protein (UPF0127 family)
MVDPKCLAALIAVLSLAACGGSESAISEDEAAVVMAFDSARLQLITATDTAQLIVELAETKAQHALGLMERSGLSQNAGMLFTYEEPQPPEAGFYMFRTRIPLDIAFIDTTGTIISIRSMDPCESPDPRWCPTYGPDSPYVAALEVNRGYFGAAGVGVGGRVLLPN